MLIRDKVIQHYPNAKTGTEVTEKYLSLLEKEYQTDLGRMLFATSVCSDDVNVSTDFRRVLSRPFTMGGLGGLPYAGFTGMVAFSHHIPDGGDAFVFYGPHIGITDEGELGRMRRIGQKRLTNSCGALMLALERFQITQEADLYTPQNVYYDTQQYQLEQSLMPYKHDIIYSENPKKSITEFTYKVIDSQLKKIIAMSVNEFSCERIFLLGGIVINTSEEYNDYVDVRNFEVIYTKESLDEFNPISILNSKAFRDL
ncbi:hypothetical protein [Siphonobacter sp. SORGH_AS_1065]|uniref:hypothetical protein n=1 Tax=Siphonobacter sp. SORGH_AS_1065 TaxID=3041795 RepID=UPI00278425B1|nr:hypothetical protein [Siphonobacter sp. SORGH_AS_1065]MDQ1090293.1 hypothetical protein [Siphonobacter sp. SORGH_AS_1065]